MSSATKHIVFDVIGTLASCSKFFEALEGRLGPKLREQGIKPTLLGFAWIEAAEREYTYLSISGKYLPFMTVFGPLFYRMLWMAGIEEPRNFANDNLLSCDTYGIGKPDKASYAPVLAKLSKDAAPENIWFAAAHMWDVSAAKRSGFRGAWCAVWEKEPCLEIFREEMDVMAESLPEMARKVVEMAK